MQLQDTAKLGGVFTIKLYKNAEDRANGKVWKEVTRKNKMTNTSLAVISGLVGNTGAQTAFTYLALGTSSTAVSAAHTTLQAEITDTGLARAAATISRSTTTQTNDTLQLDYEWTASGAKSIEEIGIFNAASTGVMLARALTTTLTTVANTVVVATYKWVVVGN